MRGRIWVERHSRPSLSVPLRVIKKTQGPINIFFHDGDPIAFGLALGACESKRVICYCVAELNLIR